MRATLNLSALVVATCAAFAGVMLPADTAYAQKEKFIRSKPHVNAASKSKVKSLYFPESMLRESRSPSQSPGGKIGRKPRNR